MNGYALVSIFPLYGLNNGYLTYLDVWHGSGDGVKLGRPSPLEPETFVASSDIQ